MIQFITKLKPLGWCCCLLFLAVSCRRNTGKGWAAILHDPAHGLYRELSFPGYKMSVQYLPAAYLRARDAARGRGGDSSANGAFDYYQVELYFQPGSTPSPAVQQYLNFDIEHAFHLSEAAADSIPPAFCQRIALGSSTHYVYVIAFPGSVRHNDTRFVYNDHLLGAGRQSALFNAADLDARLQP